MNILVFDIETIPDIDGARKLYDFENMNDADVAKAMFFMRQQATGGSAMQRHYLQKIIAISVVLRQTDKVKVCSIGSTNSSEAELIQRFYEGVERWTPTLVSWNGGGFDLPVLHYRSLINKVAAPRYWETGLTDSNFKWNNYIARFHERHTDLMDVLSGYQNRAVAPLDDIATLLGFPGKMGMDGSKVWGAYLAGKLDEIRNYCETDVLNTYLVYLRFLYMQGKLTDQSYNHEYQLVLDALYESQLPHLVQFANACQPTGEIK
jgi:predicted PolB exonuclease-like 3'-5' exonuclease